MGQSCYNCCILGHQSLVEHHVKTVPDCQCKPSISLWSCYIQMWYIYYMYVCDSVHVSTIIYLYHYLPFSVDYYVISPYHKFLPYHYACQTIVVNFSNSSRTLRSIWELVSTCVELVVCRIHLVKTSTTSVM